MLITLALIAVSLPALSQHDFRKGFYIALNGDSVSVAVDFRAAKVAAERCVVKEANGSKRKFKPGEIKAYGFVDGPRYVSKTHPTTNELLFFEQLVNGKLSLFRHRNAYYISLETMILLKRGKKDANSPGGYIVTLNDIITGCGLSANETGYDERPLTNLVQNYNRCKGGSGVVYQVDKPSKTITFHALGGIDISQLTLDPAEIAFNKSVSPTFGLGVDFSAPRFLERGFLSLEVLYADKLYQGYSEVEFSQPSKIVRTDHFMDISFIKVPLSVRYDFFGTSRTPYLKAGLVKYFNLSSSLYTLEESERAGVVVTSEKKIELDSKSQSGVWLAAGYSNLIRGRFKGFVECRIEWANGFDSSVIRPDLSTTNINVLFGLRF